MIAAVVLTPVALAGCSTTSESASTDQIVLAEAQELGGYNPAVGYGELGVSPLYDGLLRPQADTDDRMPALVPALASSPPQRIGPRTWRLPLRSGVTFSDGTALDSADVVATYSAIKDPAVASDISSHLATIAEVTAAGPDAVTVAMRTDADPSPYLLVGIVPSEKVENRPAANWALNTDPVGTGPYRLDSLSPDQAVMVARDDYWGKQPEVKRLIYTHTPDDNVRAQRIITGEVDGVSLPPKLIGSIDRADIRTVAVQSADWRGISFPAGNRLTADPQARLAMNIGVDREALIRDVLAGHGRTASTPVAEVYGAAFNPDAHFSFDAQRANDVLEAAGWHRSSDGIREKNGAKASFELLYNASDTLRRDLSVAFAAAMKPLGIQVDTRGSSWDDIYPRLDRSAVLLGGGETPYSIDSQIYETLHSRSTDSSPLSNPGNFSAPELDALLDLTRETGPGPQADAMYRDIQSAYVEQPSYAFLAFLDHTYGYREIGWNQTTPIMEPHAHGVSWGPWWEVGAWTR